MTDEAPIDVLQMVVREVVGGPYCGGPDEGQLLAEFLLKVWPRYRRIRVSFRGIDVVEFPFCWALARALPFASRVPDEPPEPEIPAG